MSHVLAERLLTLVGPGRILHYACRDTSLLSALLQRGCDAEAWVIDPLVECPQLDQRLSRVASTSDSAGFDIVVVDGSAGIQATDLRTLLTSLRVNAKRTLVLDLSDAVSTIRSTGKWNGLDNIQIEAAAIAAGYRRHPAAFPASRYERLDDPSPEVLLCFEKVPDAVLERWPIDGLIGADGGRPDMSREVGPKSDMQFVRYALAAEWIRPGDTVLDCACGAGYGSALLAAASRGRHFIGVDSQGQAIAYARDHFAGYPIEFREMPSLALDFLPAHSIDMVVSFDTIEQQEDHQRFLSEIARVLKPDGRVLCNVSCRSPDKELPGPTPDPLTYFDYVPFHEALSHHFIIEARYRQTAPCGIAHAHAPRRLQQIPLSATIDCEAQWWIVVAAADPARDSQTRYSHPEFDSSMIGTHAELTAFATHYDNPWLYRQLIQNGQRIRDPDVLAAAVDTAVSCADKTSADFGGLLAVRAYAVLRQHDVSQQYAVLASIEDYLQIATNNPHVHRWQLSLCYVAGLIALDSGQRNRGKKFLEAVVGLDPDRFSPLLTTKTVAACFLLGMIALVDGDQENARASFEAGIGAARRALHAPDENAIGRPDRPLTFGFFELAEIADMAGQCAMAIHGIDQYRYAPGQFWRCVDAKRFGLFTWIRNLETEHARMQSEINRMQSENNKLRLGCTLRSLLPKRLQEVFTSILPLLARRAWTKLMAMARLVRNSGRQD
ncbi:MAG: class I SAM-dependent methyltransferase [Candidatus Accumulibacter sp.]|uniref:class I SAM-dependent methyltransferase n=1 Tax=Accumulibacter sp. TaxID=2053492 RepID=UPI0025D424D2|nr:class I SAM-dependent methyltransferase [Accumulibacter sp.]MCP5249205.1 class I SAM-dependent methyltransferase [Accumulibacter sp.]